MKKKYLPNPYSFQSAETGKRRFAEFLTTILKKGLSFLAVTLFPTFILFLTATGTISAQTVTVSNAGSIVSGDYTYYGIVNGKNAYLRNYRDYSSNTYCSGSSCLEELRIYWDNEKWVLTSKAEGGDCWVCPTGAETLIASNTESGSPAAPCSAWTSSFYENLTLTGSCQGGALSDLVLSATSLCQTGVLTLNWVNNATLGVGNVFTVTLSDESGNYNSGTTELGTLASTTAISMMVTLPAYMASSAGYTLRLTASQAPESAYTFTSPTFTIGLPNERPSSLPSGISVCEGQPATLETLSTYASYQWYKGETTQISGADGQQYVIASVTESDEGFYSVLGVTGDGCRTDISSGIQLNVNNAPSIDYSYYPAPVCEGALENGLSVTSYGAGTYTYTWKKGGEIVKTETTTSNTSTYVPVGGWLTSHAGSYTATVSQVGCPNPAVSSEALLEVDQELETPTLTPSGSAVAPVTFTATAGFRRYNLYKWDGTAYSFYTDYHTNTFTISIGGKYLVRGQNACGETANSNEVSVTTLCDTPPVLATSSENSIPATLTTTSGFHYYLWYKWNGSEYVYVTTTSANSYSATAYGQYSVRATSGCGTTVFSNAATIVDQCKGETVAPQILSLPSTLNAPCGSPATWTVSASDNCTVPERITFRYYITGGSAIGAVDNLQNGTGSGTVFTADAVVHIIAIDAAGNVSAERTISITAGGDCTPPTGIPLDGLIAWYPFNGNANDESGHNLHGTGTDVALTTDRFGNEGKAYDFNGSSSFIEVADNEAWFRPDQISVSLWVNSRSNSDLQNFFGKAHFGYWSNSWGLASDFGGGNGAFFGVVGHEYNQLGVVGTGENRINDAWTHLAMVYDKPAAKLKLYVNGIKKGETNYDGTILYDNSPIQIGRDIENGNPAFFTDGKIDDIAVYDRPLTEEEIRSMACMEGSYAFADLSATEACEGGTSDVTIAFPALSAGAVVDISYKLDEGAVKTAAATINSANQAMFQTSVITVAATLTLLEVKAHGADCGQAFTGSNTVLITTKDCSAGDPVAWYPFDGNARDVIGSLDGTVNGATLTSDRFGNPNSAYAFDGIDDFIETATVATSQTDNWAITTWIKPANLVQEGAVAMNGYDDLGSGNGYTVLLKNSQLSGLFSGVSWYDSDKYVSAPNVWYHVALTRLNGVTKVYLNGQPASYGNSTDPQTPSGHLRIGAHIGGRFFNGVIDEVKIFGKALDDNQVFMEYETTKAPLTVASGIGSGKALSFDGIDDCVDLHTQLIPTSGNFTVDLWLKNRSVSGFREFVSQGPDGNAFFIGTSDNSNLLRAGSNWLETGVELPLNDWAHVAIVKSGSTGLLYLDGVLRATKENYYIGDGGSATAFARQFGYYGEYPDADLDEARFWNTALTQSQIRDRMARKITPSDPLFDHLLAYYNFDQEDALVVTDVKSGHNGTLVNRPSWVTSGAPIGDASAHTYGGNSVSIAHDQGESLTVSDFSAIPTGVHVYVVNSAPNSTSGIAGPGQNDRYFGVHYFGQSGVSYTVSYYYAGNPYVNSSNEAGLTIFKRDNNADPTWQAAGLALSNENQTISVISMDSEYMLGSESGALPVTLLSFIARKHESSVDLSWQTTEETNSDHFEVLHSPDGKTWAAVGSLNAARESNSVISYRYLHSSPVNGINYYRLKTVDRDGSIAYSGIASVALETVFSQVVYPNPVDGSYMTVSYHGRRPEISLTDMTGRRIGVGILEERPGVLRLEPEHRLPSGVYILRATDGKAQVVHKVIVAE